MKTLLRSGMLSVTLLLSSTAFGQSTQAPISTGPISPAPTTTKTHHGGVRVHACKGKHEFAACGAPSVTGLASAGQCVKGHRGRLVCRKAGEFCNAATKQAKKAREFKRGHYGKDEKNHLTCRPTTKHKHGKHRLFKPVTSTTPAGSPATTTAPISGSSTENE